MIDLSFSDAYGMALAQAEQLRQLDPEMDAYRVASHLAEEVGETIGASNKLVQGRGNEADFLAEWAQAAVQLFMLGSRHSAVQDLVDAFSVEVRHKQRLFDLQLAAEEARRRREGRGQA